MMPKHKGRGQSWWTWRKVLVDESYTFLNWPEPNGHKARTRGNPGGTSESGCRWHKSCHGLSKFTSLCTQRGSHDSPRISTRKCLQAAQVMDYPNSLARACSVAVVPCRSHKGSQPCAALARRLRPACAENGSCRLSASAPLLPQGAPPQPALRPSGAPPPLVSLLLLKGSPPQAAMLRLSPGGAPPHPVLLLLPQPALLRKGHSCGAPSDKARNPPLATTRKRMSIA